MAVHSQKNALVNGKSNTEIAVDLSPWLVKYKDGRVERLAASTFVPASEAPGALTGVATRDVVIDPSTGVSVRLFLNVGAAVPAGRKLPLIVYFHGGSFCTGSAFSKLFHRYATSLSARAGALVVSVDYRLAPEHPIPAAYEDGSTALRWVATLSDPWLADHADPERVFLAGESCGANIAHNVAALPDGNDNIAIEGLILLQPYFWGTERLPSETGEPEGMFTTDKVDNLWPLVTAGAAGNDDPRVNPPAHQVAMLPCRRALVAVASKDVIRERGCWYAELLRKGDKCREVKLVESQGEDHGFHLYRTGRASAVELMNSVVDFINTTTPAPIVSSETELFHVARTHAHAREAANKVCRAVLGRPKPPKSRFGLVLGPSTSFKLVQKGIAPAALGGTMAQSSWVTL